VFFLRSGRVKPFLNLEDLADGRKAGTGDAIDNPESLRLDF